MSSRETRVAVLGAGAFGTALAILYSQFIEVLLFSGFSDHAERMRTTRKNEFLHDFDIPPDIQIDTISNINKYSFDYILWCFPVSPSIEILSQIQNLISPEIPVIVCSKGICDNGKFPRDAISERLPHNDVGVLAGPNLSVDIASLKFSAAVVGFRDMRVSDKVCEDLSNSLFRLSPNNDIIGIQIAGALKNVVAIACGICHGLNLGQNAFAALITIGLEEMCELGRAMKACEYTFYGLSGVGDLVLTTSSALSRNMLFGSRLAAGESAKHIKETSLFVSEGAECINNVIDVCNRFRTKSTICRTVCDIINGTKRAEEIVTALEA